MSVRVHTHLAVTTTRTSTITLPLTPTAAATAASPTSAPTKPLDSFTVASTAVVHGSVANQALPAIAPRRLPDLDAAIADPTITPLSPASVAVPDDVMAVIRSAKRVLVIGHIPPDGDCVGSAAGLAAALRAAGKEAFAVVDDQLPASSRAIAGGGVDRAAAHDGEAFDLVIVVDVAAAARIGGAARFVAAADNVLVIDHHEGGPTRAGLGLAATARLTTWNDPHADAAAVLIAGVAARLDDTGVAFAAAKRELASAMYTDTLAFKAPGARLETLRLFKGVVDTVDALHALRAALQPPLHAEVVAVLADAHPVIGVQGAAVVVDQTTWNRAIDVAASVDPAIVLQDLRGHLADRLDGLRDAHGFAALAIDEGTGVRVSLRSLADGPAHDVAIALGGGGHGRAAASFMTATLDETLQRLGTATKQMHLAREAKLRSGRLLDSATVGTERKP